MPSKDYTHRTGTCLNCRRKVTGILTACLSEDGGKQYTWVCPYCNRRGCLPGPDGKPNGVWIAANKVEKTLTQEQVEHLPVIMPNLFGRCTRCGSRGAQLHHWAPKAIFNDDEAELWPKDYLCEKCHNLWHLKVTPQLVNPPKFITPQ